MKIKIEIVIDIPDIEIANTGSIEECINLVYGMIDDHLNYNDIVYRHNKSDIAKLSDTWIEYHLDMIDL